jgi:hypothetical protein
MLALSLFGTVAGLEVRTFGQLPTPLADEWIALNSGDLRLQEGQTVVAVNRRKTNAGILTWVGLYRPAIEMTSDRGGGCVGAGVWILNKLVPAAPVLELLGALTQQLTTLAMSGGRFVRRISAVEGAIDWREDIGKRMRNLVDLPPNGGLGSGDLPKAFFDASAAGPSFPLGWIIDVAQKGGGLDKFRALFLSGSESVAESVRRNGRLEILTLDTLLSAQVCAEQRLYEELSQAQQRLQEVERCLVEESAARLSIDRQLAELGSSHALASRERDESNVKRRALAEELEQQRGETETLRHNWTQAERDIQSREDDLNHETALLDERNRQQQLAYRQREEGLKAREDDQKRQSATLDKQVSRIAEHEAHLNERSRQLKAASGQLAEWQTRAKNAEYRVLSLERQLTDHHHIRDDHARQIESLQARLSNTEHDRAGIATELESHNLPRRIESARRPTETHLVSKSDFIYEDPTPKRRHAKPYPWRVIWSMPFLVGGAVLLGFMLAALLRHTSSDLPKHDESASATQTCDSDWDEGESYLTARARLIDALPNRSVVQAIWGLACAENRPAACFPSDVEHMTRDLHEIEDPAASLNTGHYLTTLAINLPNSCRMPSNEPLTLGFGEFVPGSPSPDSLRGMAPISGDGWVAMRPPQAAGSSTPITEQQDKSTQPKKTAGTSSSHHK